MKKILEIRTPYSLDIDAFVDGLGRLDEFDALVIEENGGVDALVVAERVRQRCGKEIFLRITCRDRNRIGLHSQLTTAAAGGFTNLVLADGAHPLRTSFPDAKPVYELDALSLLRMLKRQSPPFGADANSALSSVAWQIAVCVGGSTSADIGRARGFVEAGADMFFVSSPEAIPRMRELTDKPIFLSIADGGEKKLGELVEEIESAGADGINLILEAPDRVFDGSVTAE